MDKTRYRQAFDSVFAPDGAEDKVLSAVLSRPRRRMSRAALVLCVVLMLVCGAALASGIAGEWLEGAIGLNGGGAPQENLQKIGKTVEADGMRLTLDSAASDGVHTYFLLNVEALEGQDFSNTDPETIPMEDSIYVDFNLQLPSGGGYGFRAIRIDDGADPSRAQLILKFDFGVPRNGSRLTLTISSLERGIWTTGENGKRVFTAEPVAEGEWSFSFWLNRRLDGVHYKMEPYDFDVRISPLGMAIDGVGSRRFGQEAYLVMQDGSQVELIGYGYSSGERNGDIYRELVSYEFTALIDPAQAAALVADGVEYPLTPAK